MTRTAAGDFLARVREAVRKDAPDQFPSIFAEHCSFAGRDKSEDGVLHEREAFEGLLALMRDDQFLRMARSSELMSIWEYEWGTLSEDQRAQLLELLKEIVPRVADDVSAFVASELLGQFYDHAQSMPVVQALAVSPAPVARLYVPHAVVHLLRRTRDDDHRARLIECLHAMREDSSEDVRREVGAALRALEAPPPA